MNRLIGLGAAIALTAAAFGQASTPARPPITGVSHISVYTTHPDQAQHFYQHDLGFKKMPDPENPAGVRYYVDSQQFVEVLPLPAGQGVNRLDHIGWITTNARAMRLYLKAHGVAVPEQVQHGNDGSYWFNVHDPEGNKVQFLQPPAHGVSMAGADPIGHRMIHVGMLVHSRAKEDTFYRDILGFRPYWYGGMQSGKIDWVSQQVPNGRDWLEYMLTSGPSGSGIPANISQHQLGVLDHFSIGVVNMEKAVTTLDSEGRLKGNEHQHGPQLGRDGKWQFNLYDPDEIRVELMEYKPAEKPCCSPFTAANPVPPTH
uniref:Glyoxalase n=1 Tax=Acidobacterium capsulatum TaxID=33075 RepID=A0A7V5CSE7_9BACT